MIYIHVSIVIIIIVIANYSLVSFSRTLTTRVHQVFETHSGLIRTWSGHRSVGLQRHPRLALQLPPL